MSLDSHNPLHATCYADHAIQQTVTVTENVAIAESTFRTRFACPDIAARAIPGQFLMLRLAAHDDPLIGRPLAVYDIVDESEVDVVYVVGGKLTRRLAELQPGRELDVWGPLGNGFSPDPVDHLIMVAGGIGQTPFLCLGKEFLGRQSFGTANRAVEPAKRVSLCYGARSAAYLAGISQFERQGIEVHVSTDDGSVGRHGLVTEILDELLLSDDSPTGSRRIACCGPEPMMEAVAELASKREVRCQVSLETPMACGIGICFTCVAKVTSDDGSWDYKRTCVDGPVFESNHLQW